MWTNPFLFKLKSKACTVSLMKSEKGKKFCKILICGEMQEKRWNTNILMSIISLYWKPSSFEAVVWFNVNCKRIEKKKKKKKKRKKNFAETPCSLTQCDLAEFEWCRFFPSPLSALDLLERKKERKRREEKRREENLVSHMQTWRNSLWWSDLSLNSLKL